MNRSYDKLSRLQGSRVQEYSKMQSHVTPVVLTQEVPYFQSGIDVLSPKSANVTNPEKFDLFRARTTTRLSIPVSQTDLSPISHRSGVRALSSSTLLQSGELIKRSIIASSRLAAPDVYPLTGKYPSIQTLKNTVQTTNDVKPIFVIRREKTKPTLIKQTTPNDSTVKKTCPGSASRASALPGVTMLSDSLNFSTSNYPPCPDSAQGSTSNLGISLGNSLGMDIRDLCEERRAIKASSSAKPANSRKDATLEASLLMQKIQFRTQSSNTGMVKKYRVPAKIPASASRAYNSRAPVRPRAVTALSTTSNMLAKAAGGAKAPPDKTLNISTDANIDTSAENPPAFAGLAEGKAESLRASTQIMNGSSVYFIDMSQNTLQGTKPRQRPQSADSTLNRKRPMSSSATFFTPHREMQNQADAIQRLSKSSGVAMSRRLDLTFSIKTRDISEVALPQTLSASRSRPQSAQPADTKEYLSTGNYKLPFNRLNINVKPRKIEPIIKPVDRIHDIESFNPSGYIYSKGRIEKEKQDFLRQCNGVMKQYPASAVSYPRKPRRLSWYSDASAKGKEVDSERTAVPSHAWNKDQIVDEEEQADFIAFDSTKARADPPRTPIKPFTGPASARTAILETPSNVSSNAAVIQQYTASLANRVKQRPASAGASLSNRRPGTNGSGLPEKIFLIKEPLKRTQHKHQFSMFFDPTATAESYDRTVRFRSRPSSACSATSNA